VVVVHNGIIENYRELMAELAESGATFESETDTEVIAHLCATMIGRGLGYEDATAAKLARLRPKTGSATTASAATGRQPGGVQ
jgi:glucosamine--fructose-6-phosphate aminotransferase (isomerizing)